MKGISLHEPWASAVALDLKRYETRGYHLHWRGDLAICAARTSMNAELIYSPALVEYFRRVGITKLDQLSFGCIVAICRVPICLPAEEIISNISAQEKAFGDYGPGRVAWPLENLRRLKNPIPFRGQQGIFNIPGSVVRQMEFI